MVEWCFKMYAAQLYWVGFQRGKSQKVWIETTRSTEL